MTETNGHIWKPRPTWMGKVWSQSVRTEAAVKSHRTDRQTYELLTSFLYNTKSACNLSFNKESVQKHKKLNASIIIILMKWPTSSLCSGSLRVSKRVGMWTSILAATFTRFDSLGSAFMITCVKSTANITKPWSLQDNSLAIEGNADNHMENVYMELKKRIRLVRWWGGGELGWVRVVSWGGMGGEFAQP